MRKIISYFLALLLCIPAMAQKENLENLLIDAVSEYDAGNVEKAGTMLAQIHAADSTSDAACYYLALCELRQGRAASGTDLLKKAVALDSTNVWYRHILASQLVDGGDYPGAAPILARLVKDFPQAYNNPFMLTTVGDAQLSVYKDSLALSFYDRALKIQPDYAPAELGRAEVQKMQNNMAGYFMSLGSIIRNPEVRPNAKHQILDNIMQNLEPRTWWVWSTQIKDLISSNLEMHPDDIDANFLQMNIAFIEKDTTAVIDICRNVIPLAVAQDNKDKLLQSWSIIGDMMHEQGFRKTAYQAYENALAVDPEYAPVLNNYAYFLCMEGRKLKKAEKMSAITVRDNPDNATYLDTYAWILHLLKRDAEAKPYLKHAMIYGGRDSKVVLQHYAEVLRALGDGLADYYQSLADQK